ncbi:MAG: LytTR family DNA-binding domain-containing protein [Bacteroidota bacterium]
MLDRLSNYSSFKLDNLIVITSENQKEHFHVKANNLLFIKAANNYVEVFFRSQQNVKKQLLRKTLKGIEGEYLSSPFLVRCHCSYLINPNNIDHIIKAGNKTVLNISGVVIPVSNKYISRLNKKIALIFHPSIEVLIPDALNAMVPYDVFLFFIQIKLIGREENTFSTTLYVRLFIGFLCKSEAQNGEIFVR